MSGHVDVLVVGAGISGIDAGYHLQASCPGKTYAILEARDTLGGTWDLFRYPGIRSDSDMYTLGFPFRPWRSDKAIADGKARIAAAGNAGKQFAVADGWKEGSTISIRMFGQGALVSQTAIALGLKNAWNGKVDEAWGLGATDVEGLSSIKDTDLRFFYNASDGDDVFAAGLAGNPIWESMTFVKNKQLHKMPNGIWTFGGPLSCQQHIDAIVKAFTA